jgi:hypothetical protein
MEMQGMRQRNGNNRAAIVAAAFLIAICAGLRGRGACQEAPAAAPEQNDGFARLYTPENPQHLSINLFGGGFASDQYATVQEGVQLEQSITEAIGLVGRFTGYQLFVKSGFGNPIASSNPNHSFYNFGRLQGGIGLAPYNGTNLYILGGRDVGGSDAATAEADLTSWFFLQRRHPLNLAVSSIYNTQNQIDSNEIDLQTVIHSNEKMTLVAGAGGAIYAGGYVHGLEGQGGGIFGVFFPSWQLGLEAQVGYGDARQYGQLSIVKQLSFNE